MLQLLWNMFSKTGQINTYVLYKEMENVKRENDVRLASGELSKEGLQDSPSLDKGIVTAKRASSPAVRLSDKSMFANRDELEKR